MTQGHGNNSGEADREPGCWRDDCDTHPLECDHAPRLTTDDVEELDSLVARDNASTREQMKVLWRMAVDVKDYR